MNNKLKKQSGFSSLLIVSLIGLIVLTLAVTLSNVGIVNINNVVDYYSHQRAKATANACVEYVLQSIRNNGSFVGSDNIDISDYTCSYTVNDLGNENREIQVQAIVDDCYSKIEVNIDQINPQINISFWQEY